MTMLHFITVILARRKIEKPKHLEKTKCLNERPVTVGSKRRNYAIPTASAF